MIAGWVRFAQALIRWALVLAGVGAIVFAAGGRLLPTLRAWDAWRPPMGVAALGCVVATMAWPSRRPGARERKAAGIAVVFGLASFILGIALVMLVGYGIGLNFLERNTTINGFIYQTTDPSVMKYLLTYATGAAVPGCLGLWVVRWFGGTVNRVSLAATAQRFSWTGLSLCALIFATVAAASVYRWATWGFMG